VSFITNRKKPNINLVYWLFILLIGCNNSSLENDEENGYQTCWPLEVDSANFAILFVDWPTFNLKEGHFSKYNKCTSCEGDTLPIRVEVTPPTQNDDDRFYYLTYIETGDTIFHSSYGPWFADEIYIPEMLVPADSFETIDSIIQKPTNFEILKSSYILIGDSVFIEAKIDSIWQTIGYLNIVNDFSNEPYNIGFFSYSYKTIVSILYR